MRPPRAIAGLTLIELVVVIVILAMILGFAVYILQSSSKNLSVPAARTQIASMIRFARDAGRLNNAPTWVLIDAKDRSCSLLVKEVVGQWHLEDDANQATTGAFDKHAKLKDADRGRRMNLVNGRIGKAIHLTGRSRIECPEVPTYHPQQGFSVEFWMQRDAADSTQTILTIGKTVRVEIRKTAYWVRPCTWCGKTIEAQDKVCPLCGREPVKVKGQRRDGVLISARAGNLEIHNLDPLVPFEWYRIEFLYAAGEARLYLNDILVAAEQGTADWNQGAPLIFGADPGGFQGILDELSLSLILPRDTYTLAPNVAFEFDEILKPNKAGQFLIHFDREGRLDPSKHAAAVSFKIKSPTEEAALTIEPSGAVAR